MSVLVTATAAALAREFAPGLIARLTSDRGGEVARQIVETATRAAEVKRGASAEETVQAIKADPDRVAAAQVELQALERREYELEVADRISAREYRASLTPQERTRGMWMVAAAFVLLVAAIGAVVMIELREVDAPQGLALLLTVASLAVAMLKDAFGFEFGSSRGSKDKDAERRAQERRQEPRLPQPAPTPPETPSPPVAEPETRPVERIEPEPPRSRDFVGEIMAM